MATATRSLATAQSKARFASGLLPTYYTTSRDTTHVAVIPRSYGDQGGLTMKLASSAQSAAASQGFAPPPLLAM